jgi:RimJ/RimL family protein N-acetyltransferase
MSAPEGRRRVRLAPATLDQLDAYFRDPAELADVLGSRLPDGWPLDPNAFIWVANALQSAPDEASRWMHWAFDADDGRLVGDGGFRTKSGGVLEIGYEVAAEFRGHGYATAMVQALVELAFSDPAVNRVDAHLLPTDTASAIVLSRAGFRAGLEDDASSAAEERGSGRVESWSLTRDSAGLSF